MALADVYDILISKKPYKKALPPETALQIIQEGSGVQFDPALVDVVTGAVRHF
jgi:HD-GYP domain-containing protein (c-di-GMP phosphodiesterase class II)